MRRLDEWKFENISLNAMYEIRDVGGMSRHDVTMFVSMYVSKIVQMLSSDPSGRVCCCGGLLDLEY